MNDHLDVCPHKSNMRKDGNAYDFDLVSSFWKIVDFTSVRRDFQEILNFRKASWDYKLYVLLIETL